MTGGEQRRGVGRNADVYDVGKGRVLRRYRDGRPAEFVAREAEVMAHARAHGVPVPEVFGVSGCDIVMERAAGPVDRGWLETATRHRIRDPNVLPEERARLERMLRRREIRSEAGRNAEPLRITRAGHQTRPGGLCTAGIDRCFYPVLPFEAGSGAGMGGLFLLLEVSGGRYGSGQSAGATGP